METSIFEMMQEKQLVTKRGTVFYWYSKCSDADTTLVFLHGLTADHTLFEKQLSHYRSRVNLLCWDAPAHGKSRPYKEFSYDAAKVLKEILDQEYIKEGGQSIVALVLQHRIRPTGGLLFFCPKYHKLK